MSYQSDFAGAEAGTDDGGAYSFASNWPIARPRRGGTLQRKAASFPRPKHLKVVPSPKSTTSSWVEDQLAANVGKRFKVLAAALEKRLGPTGFFRDLHSCEEHLAIVALGPRVVPFLLKDMKNGVGTWYLALQALTGAKVGQNVPPGDLRALTQAWITWGEKHNLL